MDLVLRNTYKIQILSESVSLKDAIDGIAYTLNVSLVETDELKEIGIVKGDSIELYDYAYDTASYSRIFYGVVWDTDKDKKNKKITLTGKERTRVIEESEDEYLWSDGQTATQRGTIICNDWGIPIGTFANTSIALSKDKRKESLFSMLKKDLKETAQKSGGLYKYRMTTSLDLIELGTNPTIYILDSIIDDYKEKDSLSGAITQIKVLGKEETKGTDELVLSPIIGVFKRNTEKYGALQKIVDDDKVDDYSKAQSKANCLFSDGETSQTLSCCKDINTLRSGDLVSVYNETVCVTEITHNLGSTGKMSLSVMSLEDVRRKFYSE